jgi:hypothetical protein
LRFCHIQPHAASQPEALAIGHRIDPEDGVGAHGLACLAVLPALLLEMGGFPFAAQQGDAAGDLPLLKNLNPYAGRSRIRELSRGAICSPVIISSSKWSDRSPSSTPTCSGVG